jgi:twitching motility protein PilI
MANPLAQTPYQWLQDLERRARQRAKGLPRHEKIDPIWRGIGFRLGQHYLVSAMNEIREVIPRPTQLARVPGAKSWIKGLANIRGLLIPVVDLKGCLEGKPIVVENRTRMLIINQSSLSAGLLVDEVMGIKHFPEHLRDSDTPCKEAWIAPFSMGLFTVENVTWIIFDMQRLVENETFLQAAL